MQPLYRQRGADFWANPQRHFDLRMGAVTGCPDEDVLVITETLVLAHWKVQWSA
ncbi:hypothetical protein SCP_1102480 [Sparassis crispa]|uniref:Uncharacterized protein n=1 Tax=Sparassis crispa TaxID=139825 RepID=A0A401GZH9_9APHY|nr:hypothetical protein SCP_1102480 [Sparassis crispa]GBE87571.1 hypothetical protein SCP_1102480 [Sparassis crispa]